MNEPANHMGLDSEVFDSTQALQFGLEIEFLAEPAPSRSSARATESHSMKCARLDQCYHGIAMALKGAGFRAAFKSETAIYGITSPLITGSMIDNATKPKLISYIAYLDPQAIDYRTRRPIEFQAWIVKREHDIRGPNNSLFASWIQTELNTPVLPESEASNGFTNVKKALDVIYENKNGQISINRGCGLHVHVSPDAKMTLRHVKRAASILLVIEETLLFRLCSKYRRKFQRLVDENLTTKPTTADQIYYAANDVDVLTDIPKSLADEKPGQIAQIWECFDVSDLEELFKRRWEVTYPASFAFRTHQRVDVPGDPVTHSLEFRHAQSSLNKNFVKNWVLVVLAVYKVTLLPGGQFKTVLENLWKAVSEAKEQKTTDKVWCQLLNLLNTSLADEWDCKLDLDYWHRRLESDIETATGGLDVDADGKALLN